MDGFTYPVHSSIWEDSSDKQYEVELESPVFITPPAHLISNGDDAIGLGADSAYLPVTGGCELTNLPLDPITSSDPAMWASYQNLNDLGVQNQTHLNGSGLLAQQKYLNGMNELNLNSFASGSQMMFGTTGFPQALDISHQDKSLANANQLLAQLNGVGGTGIGIGTGGGFDGPFKPRIRARRGQATDPHSIAERLRREKISERMKSLQELVPNSNRTDKASMLDEIIDYVKFLQLQVKVLSMSRLGATEAVVPLLTESQPEGSSSSISSVSIKPTQLDTCRASEALKDSVTFEQEVIKLMDSNVTSAMQYLQNKGLCLMPIALASAINTQKGTHTASIPSTNRNSNSSLCGDQGFQ